MNKIIMWFKANIGIKIFALLIGILIWFHVRTERTYELTFSLPLCFENMPYYVSFVEPPPKYVETTIEATGKELIRLKLARNLSAVYDFSDATTGWRRIDLSKENIKLPYWSKANIIKGPFPKSFVVHLQETLMKTVEVIPNIEGNHQIKILPSKVEIPQSSSLTSIETEKIKIKQALPCSLKVALIIPEGVKTSTDSVTVIVNPQE